MHIGSVIYGKKGKWILLKGDGMVTEWHWMVTEWWLKCTCHSVDWMVTEKWLIGAFQFSRNGGVSSCGGYFIVYMQPVWIFHHRTFIFLKHFLFLIRTNIVLSCIDRVNIWMKYFVVFIWKIYFTSSICEGLLLEWEQYTIFTA